MAPSSDSSYSVVQSSFDSQDITTEYTEQEEQEEETTKHKAFLRELLRFSTLMILDFRSA